MNQPAFKEETIWGRETEEDTRAKILIAWLESNDAPGKYLKKFRELQKKTVKEMATELGVSISQLDALESDNKDVLPAPIYVKSYIKRYCVCLGIGEDEISSVLDKISKEVLPTLNRVSFQQNVNPRQIFMRWFGYALIAAVAILFIYGVKSMDFSGLWNTISTSSSATAEESKATELSLPVVIEESDLATQKSK